MKITRLSSLKQLRTEGALVSGDSHLAGLVLRSHAGWLAGMGQNKHRLGILVLIGLSKMSIKNEGAILF